MRLTTKQAARGKWDGVLSQLIGEQAVSRKHGPCPICGGRDRYRYDNKQNDGDWFCNVCGVGDGFRLLQEVLGIGFVEAARKVDQIVNNIEEKPFKPPVDTDKRREALNRIWMEAKSPEVVLRHLTDRGINTDTISEMSRDVRGHPALGLYEGKKKIGEFPAMLALIRNSKGEPVSIHRTYINDKGKNAKKIMPPTETINGCCVRLFEPNKTLAFAEGIETALSAAQMLECPCWATISAHGMKEVKSIPRQVEKVIVVPDNDFSYTGQAAGFTLAAYLKQKLGIKVEVIMPTFTGQDMNDWANEQGWDSEPLMWPYEVR